MNAKRVGSLVLVVLLAGCGVFRPKPPPEPPIPEPISRDGFKIVPGHPDGAKSRFSLPDKVSDMPNQQKAQPFQRQPGRDYYEDFTTWAEKDAYAMRQYNCHPIKHFEGKEYGIPAGSMMCVIAPRALVSLYGSGKLASAYFVYLPRYDYGEFAINTTVNCENNLAWDNIVGTPGSTRSVYYYPAEAVRALCNLVWNQSGAIPVPINR